MNLHSGRIIVCVWKISLDWFCGEEVPEDEPLQGASNLSMLKAAALELSAEWIDTFDAEFGVTRRRGITLSAILESKLSRITWYVSTQHKNSLLSIKKETHTRSKNSLHEEFKKTVCRWWMRSKIKSFNSIADFPATTWYSILTELIR